MVRIDSGAAAPSDNQHIAAGRRDLAVGAFDGDAKVALSGGGPTGSVHSDLTGRSDLATRGKSDADVIGGCSRSTALTSDFEIATARRNQSVGPRDKDAVVVVSIRRSARALDCHGATHSSCDLTAIGDEDA